MISVSVPSLFPSVFVPYKPQCMKYILFRFLNRLIKLEISFTFLLTDGMNDTTDSNADGGGGGGQNLSISLNYLIL
jgi:hypothetical protein